VNSGTILKQAAFYVTAAPDPPEIQVYERLKIHYRVRYRPDGVVIQLKPF